ncbi:MAG TPA: hypothetical protein VFN67_37480 [Polyangiales bacterium]|nr:hypothetical protein [Polyangiales bacterium]
MTPEKLQSWIYRPVTNSKTLTLTFQPTIGQETVIATWTREEVEALRDTGMSHGEDVLESAREYMSGAGERDTCRFVLAWWGDKNPNALRSMVLKLKPDEALAPPEPAELALAASGGGAQFAAMIPFFLNHISQTQRATIGSIGVLLAAHERTASMQQRVIESQQTLIQKLLESNDERAQPENAAIGEAKARVLEKLTNAIPDIVAAGVHFAAGGKLAAPAEAAQLAPPKPKSRAELKQAALDALGALDPDEIADLDGGGNGADDGATDDAH